MIGLIGDTQFIDDAIINGVIYPSLDPSIFELKYPTTDIIGNATQ